MNFCEKKFDSDKMHFFLLAFKMFKCAAILVHAPFAPVFPWFGMSCDVDSGTRNFRPYSSRLFSAVHTKC